jgi:hypothetical protein
MDDLFLPSVRREVECLLITNPAISPVRAAGGRSHSRIKGADRKEEVVRLVQGVPVRHNAPIKRSIAAKLQNHH